MKNIALDKTGFHEPRCLARVGEVVRFTNFSEVPVDIEVKGYNTFKAVKPTEFVEFTLTSAGEVAYSSGVHRGTLNVQT